MKGISEILEAFKKGDISLSDAQAAIESAGVVNISHTRLDIGRRSRTGVGEVVYGAGKTKEQILDITRKISDMGENTLITRVSKEASDALLSEFPQARHNEIARTVSVISDSSKRALSDGFVAIVTAGTSDMYVAEEARETLDFLGDKVKTFYDCGVAGLHRILSVADEIRAANAVIVIAGMEGALASVAAGLLKVPVIAVPTSVGYGASFGGLAALLSMINSCANGVSIVNIDNGYGAAYNAHLINSRRK